MQAHTYLVAAAVGTRHPHPSPPPSLRSAGWSAIRTNLNPVPNARFGNRVRFPTGNIEASPRLIEPPASSADPFCTRFWRWTTGQHLSFARVVGQEGSGGIRLRMIVPAIFRLHAPQYTTATYCTHAKPVIRTVRFISEQNSSGALAKVSQGKCSVALIQQRTGTAPIVSPREVQYYGYGMVPYYTCSASQSLQRSCEGRASSLLNMYTD